MNHVAEFMRLHGGILQFSQHGLQKYNDVMTKQYFRATNHKGVALDQIMEKQSFGGILIHKLQKCLPLPALW